MKRFFTLIELIVVIAVLGILAAIIIPNISSFQEEANTTAIVSNVRNLQTGVDMYSLDNYSSVPTLGGQPTEYQPKPIDFNIMHPNYTRDLPETPGVKYWVDGWGKVWASSVDAPKNVELTTTTLTWDTVPEADMYKVYKVLSPTNTASLLNTNTKLVFYKEASKDENVGFPVDNENMKYAVSAVDQNKFESAPAGSNYQGFENYTSSSQDSIGPITFRDTVDLEQFNQVTYVDSLEGDDLNGDGTELKPYRTMQKAESVGRGSSNAIVLGSGNYVFDHNSSLFGMNVFGQGKDTKLTFNRNQIYFQHSFTNGQYNRYGNIQVMSPSKFYNMKIELTGSGNSGAYFINKRHLEFHNVVIHLQLHKQDGIIINSGYPANGNTNIYNSIVLNNSYLITQEQGSKETLIIENSYGDLDINNKYTNTDNVTSNTNIHTTTPNLDLDYKILDNGWKDSGTGKDNDGSVADIGVYGGIYSW